MTTQKKIKVVSLFTYLHFGGDENRVLYFGRFVDREKFDHRVLVITPPAEEENSGHGPMVEHYQKYGVPVDTLELDLWRIRQHWRKRLGKTLSDVVVGFIILKRMVRYFKENRVDVVDARMGKAMFFGLIAGRLAGARCVVGTTYALHGWRSPLTWPLGQWTMSGLDALICDSHNNLEMLQRYLLRRNRRGVMIPNGIVLDQPVKTREEMRDLIGIPQDALVIAQISRILPHKGHRQLIQAAAKVLEKAPPHVVFLICGYAQNYADYREELKQLAKDLGITDRLYWLEWPGHIVDVWTTVDIHVHASLQESSPIAIHEGMSRGLPAVVTDAGGVRDELVVDGETGVVVRMGDVDGLAEGLLKVIEDKGFAAKIARGALARYEARHQPRVFAKAHEDLFAELVTANGGPL